jgi:Zn-dependent protease with chaperone function
MGVLFVLVILFLLLLLVIVSRLMSSYDEKDKRGEAISGSSLYALTFGIEFLLALARTPFAAVVALPFAIFMGALSGAAGRLGPVDQALDTIGSTFWWLIFFSLLVVSFPLLNSLVTLTGVSTGGFFTRFALGAREPSQREREAVVEVLETIRERKGNLQFHSFWYVIDSPVPNSYTVGTTLYITRGLINSEYLGALIAHEVGNLAHGDGRQLKALRNFVYPFFQHISVSTLRTAPGTNFQPPATEGAREVVVVDGELQQFISLSTQILLFLLSFSLGGFGVMILSPFWAKWFRERDYLADRVVKDLGYEYQLIDYLETYGQMETAVPYSQRWTQWSELRIDRLLHPDAEEEARLKAEQIRERIRQEATGYAYRKPQAEVSEDVEERAEVDPYYPFAQEEFDERRRRSETDDR